MTPVTGSFDSPKGISIHRLRNIDLELELLMVVILGTHVLCYSRKL